MADIFSALQAAAGARGGGVIYAANAFLPYDNRVTSTYDVSLRAVSSTNTLLGASSTNLGNGAVSANNVTGLTAKDTGVGIFNSRFVTDTETIFYFYYANESYVFSRQQLLSGMTTSSRVAFCLSNDGLTGYLYWQTTSGGVRQIRKYTRDDIFSSWTSGTAKTVSSAIGDDAVGRNSFDFFTFVEGAPNNNLVIMGAQRAVGSSIYLYDYDSNTFVDEVAYQGKDNYPTAYCAKSGAVVGNSFITFYWSELVSGTSSRVYKITCDLSALTLTIASQYTNSGGYGSNKSIPILFAPHDGTLISVTEQGGNPTQVSKVDLTTGIKGTTYSYNIGFNDPTASGFGFNEAGDKWLQGYAGSGVRRYNFTAGTTFSTTNFSGLSFSPYSILPFYAYDQPDFYT